MLGYTQEMLVTANEARIEARDAGTTTIRRRQLTSEFSYSPDAIPDMFDPVPTSPVRALIRTQLNA